jgi:hypothetical protein
VASVAVAGRTNLTNAQWAVREPLLPTGRRPGGPPQWTKRQLINGIRWRGRAGTVAACATSLWFVASGLRAVSPVGTRPDRVLADRAYAYGSRANRAYLRLRGIRGIRQCSDFPYFFKAPPGPAAHQVSVPPRRRGVRPGGPVLARR